MGVPGSSAQHVRAGAKGGKRKDPAKRFIRSVYQRNGEEARKISERGPKKRGTTKDKKGLSHAIILQKREREKKTKLVAAPL